MINIACVDRRWFQEIVDGTKTVEYRIRKRVDPRFEAIRAGEKLFICEKGSQRVIEATIKYCLRRTRPDFLIEYSVKFEFLTLCNLNIRHLQGWIRCKSLEEI